MSSTRKINKNLSLEPQVVEWGEEIAAAERRSLSNVIEILIEKAYREMTRNNGTAGANGAGRPGCECEKAAAA